MDKVSGARRMIAEKVLEALETGEHEDNIKLIDQFSRYCMGQAKTVCSQLIVDAIISLTQRSFVLISDKIAFDLAAKKLSEVAQKLANLRIEPVEENSADKKQELQQLDRSEHVSNGEVENTGSVPQVGSDLSSGGGTST